MATDPRARDLERLRADDTETLQRLTAAGFTSKDAANLQAMRATVEPHVDDLADRFFAHLDGMGAGRNPLRDAGFLEEARALKKAHLRAMVAGNYGSEYAEERLKLGRVYARAGLESRAFLGAFRAMLTEAAQLLAAAGGSPTEVLARVASLERLGTFDVGLIVDALVFERERVIRRQQDAIRELSTPVLQIREGLLLLPIIGVVDTERARQLTERLLEKITVARAKVVVLDVTGVPLVDSGVAGHLILTVAAARVMGAQAIVTGLSPSVAQTLASLGIDLSPLRTASDLQRGLEEAEAILVERVA